VGHLCNPQLVRSGRGEVALYQIHRSRCCIVEDRRLGLATANNVLKTQLAHQPLDGTACDFDLLSAQLLPDLASAVDSPVLVPDPIDLLAQHSVPLGSLR